jgi:2-polyprenyl-6-methoxyphenol hydroxylase-like FAD-dependent oxidoreductase
MSTALLLGHYGVKALAVEHHRGTAIHPRAAQISQRTMEIFRTVGVEQIVPRKSDDQFVQDGAIMAVETLAGKEPAYFIANLNEGIRDVSPTERVFISQSLLEPLLKSRAEELGATLRFGADVLSFEQDAEGVTAIIRDRDSGAARPFARCTWWPPTAPPAAYATGSASRCGGTGRSRTVSRSISVRTSRRSCAAGISASST